MKKKIISILIALLLAGALAGLIVLKVRLARENARIEAVAKTLDAGQFDKAISGLGDVGRSFEGWWNRDRILRLSARARLGAQQWDAAKPLLETLSKSAQPADRDLGLVGLALVSEKQNRPADALPVYEQVEGRQPPTPSLPQALLGHARLLASQGLYREALPKVRQVIEQFPDIPEIDQAIDILGNVNMHLLFSKAASDDTEFYVVQPGDVLPTIAAQFGMTVDLLAGINGVPRGVIRVGDRLKVVKGQFSVLVDKSLNTLTLRLNGRFFKRYHVGTGKLNSTPVGDFEITSKLKEPVWYRPDGGIIAFGAKENFLGTRWMGINFPGYGIHGTWEPDTVGKQSSAGCIRLVNADVEELFTILPEKTRVTIVD